MNGYLEGAVERLLPSTYTPVRKNTYAKLRNLRTSNYLYENIVKSLLTLLKPYPYNVPAAVGSRMDAGMQHSASTDKAVLLRLWGGKVGTCNMVSCLPKEGEMVMSRNHSFAAMACTGLILTLVFSFGVLANAEELHTRC